MAAPPRASCCGALGVLLSARLQPAGAAGATCAAAPGMHQRTAPAGCPEEERPAAWTFTTAAASIPVAEGVSVDARIFSPSPRPWAGAVFAHGGCFAQGDRDSQAGVSAMLAEMGVAVVSTSYRQGAGHPHPTATEDLAAVARFARGELWPGLPVGVVGSSSGGWHALALAREPYQLRLSFCVALCPVAHPGIRARYLQSCVNGTAARDGYAVSHTRDQAAQMLAWQRGYWQTDAAMEAAGGLLLPPGRVPTLLLLGAADKNVPEQVTRGVQAWATKTIVLGGRGHELQNGPPDSGAAAPLYVADLERFLRHAVAAAPPAPPERPASAL